MTYILPTTQNRHKKHKTKGGAVFRASLALQNAPRPIRKSLRKTFKRRMADLERHQSRYDRLCDVVDALSDDDFVAACGRNVSALNAASKRIEEIDTDICKKVDDAKKALEAAEDAASTAKNGGISDAQFDKDMAKLCKILNQVGPEGYRYDPDKGSESKGPENRAAKDAPNSFLSGAKPPLKFS